MGGGGGGGGVPLNRRPETLNPQPQTLNPDGNVGAYRVAKLRSLLVSVNAGPKPSKIYGPFGRRKFKGAVLYVGGPKRAVLVGELPT